MIFQFDVNKKGNRFSWWQMLIFVLLLLGFLILLFPKRLFINTLLHNTKPSRVSISYLKNLIANEPSNLDLRINLAEQELQIGEVQEAKNVILPYVTLTPSTEFQWKALWIYYQVTRIEAFELKENDPKRQEKEIVLKNLLTALLKSPYLNANEQAALAEDALALDLPDLANSFYKIAINRHIKKPAKFFAQAGMAALFVKDYKSSAEFYLLAMQTSSTLDDKRMYFINGANSLNSSGEAQNALEFAQKNIDGLKNDKKTLIYLAKLALMAGQQKVAERYVNQIMQIQYREPTE